MSLLESSLSVLTIITVGLVQSMIIIFIYMIWYYNMILIIVKLFMIGLIGYKKTTMFLLLSLLLALFFIVRFITGAALFVRTKIEFVDVCWATNVAPQRCHLSLRRYSCRLPNGITLISRSSVFTGMLFFLNSLTKAKSKVWDIRCVCRI